MGNVSKVDATFGQQRGGMLASDDHKSCCRQIGRRSWLRFGAVRCTRLMPCGSWLYRVQPTTVSVCTIISSIRETDGTLGFDWECRLITICYGEGNRCSSRSQYHCHSLMQAGRGRPHICGSGRAVPEGLQSRGQNAPADVHKPAHRRVHHAAHRAFVNRVFDIEGKS